MLNISTTYIDILVMTTNLTVYEMKDYCLRCCSESHRENGKERISLRICSYP
jgi:hypothetical protein